MTTIGRRSVLYLVLSFRDARADAGRFDLDEFEADLNATARWQRRGIDDALLLPHLDTQIREGAMLRAYTVRDPLRNAFDRREVWTLHAAATEPDVATRAPAERRPPGPRRVLRLRIVEPPQLFVLETGLLFVVLGVGPTHSTLADYQDLFAGVARRGLVHLEADTLPVRAEHWTRLWRADRRGGNGAAGARDSSLRGWLAALLPETVDAAPPPGGRRNPQAIGVVSVAQPPSARDRHALRLAHGSDQLVEPSEDDERVVGHDAVLRPSAREVCLFSALGVVWVVDPLEPAAPVLRGLHHVVRDRYVYKWILVEHQRLYLLALATACARISTRPEGRAFTALRLALLRYIGRYNFQRISAEERHERFYQGARGAQDIDGLFRSVSEQITEIDEYLAARRAEFLNQVLAFLTLVLTPAGIVVGIFQRETLPPGELHPRALVTPGAWVRLFEHGPFLLVLLAIVAGVLVWLRLVRGVWMPDWLRTRRGWLRSK